MPMGGSGHRPERDAGRIDGQRALQALLAAIDGTAPRQLAAAGCLGDTAIDGDVVQRQPEQAVIGGEHRVTKASSSPAAIHSSRRRRRVVAEQVRVGDALVGATEHEDLHKLVEHHPVGDAGPVATERMVSSWGGSKAENWSQMGSMMDDGTVGTRLR